MRDNPTILMVVLPYMVETDSTGAKIRSYHAFPYGVLSLVSYNDANANFLVVDLNNYPDPASYGMTIKELMKTYQPDIVGFSMMFDNSYKHLRRLLGLVKDMNCKAVTLLGGAAASYSYEEILKDQPELDAVCFGEGELPIQDLIKYSSEWQYTLDHHYSWVTRESLGNRRPVKPSFVYNLNDVIDLAYGYVDVDAYKMKQAFSPFIDNQNKRQFFLMTSRGCPFQCTFCSNSMIHGKQVRQASIYNIMDHVGYLVHHYGMEVLTIYDDQILLDTDRAKDLFRELAKFHIRVELPNGVSVAYMDEELCFLMQEAGMDTIYLAIENGSPYVLKELIRKPLKLEQVKPVVDMLRQYNFFIHGFFVMGMPGETPEHREETLDFLREIKLDWAGLNMATPVRGSALYDRCLANGWIKKQRIEDIVDKKYIINVPGVDPAELEEEVYLMNLDVNFLHNQRMAMGDYTTALKCFEDVLQRYKDHAFAYYCMSLCKKKLYRTGNYEYGRFLSILGKSELWRKRADILGVRI
jgi:radical SAM superfamily enzyme YgiQ (UPF0313 family)